MRTPNSNLNINRRIIFFWDRLDALPSEYAINVKIARALHPDYEVVVLDDRTGREEVMAAFPDLLSLYDQLRIPAAKSDIVRLAELYLKGGWYLDADIRLKRSLHHFEERSDALFFRDDTDFPRISNMVIGVSQGHAYIRDCLSLIKRYYDEEVYRHDVWALTGPGVMNAISWKHGFFEDRCLSFKEYFVDRMKTFQLISTTTSRSWIFQQALGVWGKADFNALSLPDNLTPRMVAQFIEALDQVDNKWSIMEKILSHRPQYCNVPAFRNLVVENVIHLSDFEILRDCALRFEDEIDFAYILMKRAKEIHPSGPFITRKLADYEAARSCPPSNASR